jgi:flavodoxin
MDLYIVYDRDGGGTRRAAESLAEAASTEGAEVMLMPVASAAADEVANAKALVVGCGVNMRVPFGGERPHQMASWVSKLPLLEGKPAGVFCSYSQFPILFSDAVARTAETLNELSMALETAGARVVATHAFQRRSREKSAAPLVRSVLHEEHT